MRENENRRETRIVFETREIQSEILQSSENECVVEFNVVVYTNEISE